MNDKNIVQRIAAKAVIVNDQGKILILREADTYEEGTNTGKYHIPGGRVDVGEPFFDGLKREVSEETGLEVQPGRPLAVDEWNPVIKGQPTQIIGLFIECKPLSDAITLSDEHDEFLWIDPKDYKNYDILPGETKAIQALLQ